MPRMRTTFIMSIGRHAFTESWFRDASTDDPRIEFGAALVLAPYRAVLLGGDAQIYAIRISNVQNRRQKAFTQFVTYFGNDTFFSAASNVALNMTFRNANSTQSKRVQLRGIKDDFEVKGGQPQTSNDPTYSQALAAWTAKVVEQQYGWIHTVTVLPKKIAGYSQQANGTVLIQLEPASFPLDQINTNQAVRIKGGESSPNLNGPLVVTVIDASTVVSIRPIAVRPFQLGEVMFLQRSTKDFSRAASGDIERIGNRQAGAPF